MKNFVGKEDAQESLTRLRKQGVGNLRIWRNKEKRKEVRTGYDRREQGNATKGIERRGDA